MDEQQKTDFREGDTVWCVVYGKGTVMRTNPVKVSFDKHVGWIGYTTDGRFDQTFPRSLFFSEPKITAKTTRPFVPTLEKKWLVIVMSNNQVLSGVAEKETETTILLAMGDLILKGFISRLTEMNNIPKYNCKD